MELDKESDGGEGAASPTRTTSDTVSVCSSNRPSFSCVTALTTAIQKSLASLREGKSSSTSEVLNIGKVVVGSG